MAENKTPSHGEFYWMELASNNLKFCKTFYTELLGCDYKTSNAGGMGYHEFGAADKRRAGGMFQMGAEFGDAPLHWMSYVAVTDVDVAAEKVKTLGGNVCVPPTDIPNTGKFCIFNDLSGTTISLIALKGANQ